MKSFFKVINTKNKKENERTDPCERLAWERKRVRQLSGVDDLEPKFPKAHRAVTNHAAPRNPILCPSPENHMVQNSEEYYYITSEE